MRGGDRYYVILDNDTGETLETSGPITGYAETIKFESERDALYYLERDDELCAEYYDGRYQVISLRW